MATLLNKPKPQQLGSLMKMNAVAAVREIKEDQQAKASAMKNFNQSTPAKDIAKKAMKNFRLVKNVVPQLMSHFTGLRQRQKINEDAIHGSYSDNQLKERRRKKCQQSKDVVLCLFTITKQGAKCFSDCSHR